MANKFNTLSGKTLTYDRKQSIVDVFDAVVRDRQSAIAVSFGDSQLSYEQLAAEVEKLSLKLLAMGCTRGDRVALVFDKGIDFVISVLATLKAGGIYVPIDAEYPADRIHTMMSLSGASVLLADAKSLQSDGESGLDITGFSGAVLTVDEWRKQNEAALAGYDQATLPQLALPQVTGDDPAYIIFTSGTTGQPKGVINAHNRVTNLVLHYQDQFGINAKECVSQIPSFSFDASVGEIFSALLSGAHLKIFPSLKKTDPQTLTGMLDDYQVTFSTFSPTALTLVKPYIEGETSYKLKNLKTIIVGGEPFPADLAFFYLECLPQVCFHNIYGPTETTVFCTSIEITQKLCDEFSGSILPIGYPIANCKLRINAGKRGFAEIQIGGDCVSLGYFNDVDKTDEKFVGSRDDRYYRTGDLGQISKQAYVLIAGREDDQVKIHGMRVEPGEIASMLEAHESVLEAIVVVDRPQPDQPRLVAYCTTKKSRSINTASLMAWLKKELPAHMVPAKIIALTELPMTTSGKVDRKKLPVVDWSADAEREIAPAETDAESALAQVFSEVLGVASISRYDNFYALGGDSVSALRMASILRSRGFELSQTALAKNPELHKLAKAMRELEHTPDESDTTDEPFVLAPIQHWFRSLNFTHPEFYHQSFELQTTDTLDIDALQAALHAVVTQHDQLRAYFPSGLSGEGRLSGKQKLAASNEVSCNIEYYDLTIKPEEVEIQRQAIGPMLRKQIKLTEAPLIRAAVIRLDNARHDIVLVVHHALVDTVSWHIIGQDLLSAYKQIRAGNSAVLATKTSSYYRWCASLYDLFQKDVVQKYFDIWRPELELSSRKLVRTHISSAVCKTDTLKSCTLELNAGLTDSLINRCNSAFSTTTEEMLLTSVYHALAVWMDRREVCIDLEWHGRNTFAQPGLDISNTVGWFTAIYPLFLHVEKGQDIQHTLLDLKEAKRAKICNGASFSALRYLTEAVSVRQAFENYEAPDIVFNYSGYVDSSLGTDGDEWQVLPLSAVESALENVTPYAVAIEAFIRDGRLSFEVYFHEQYCDTTAVTQLLELIGFNLRSLIMKCENQSFLQRTPSDFPLVSISACEAKALPANTANVLPLSDIQAGIFLQVNSAPESRMYHVQVLYEFDKYLDKVAFSKALEVVVLRHDALRTRFISDRVEPLQIVDKVVSVAAEFLDYSEADEATLDKKISDFIHEDGKHLFNIEQGPLFRVHVFSLNNTQKFRVLLNIHHLIHDGWSLAILMDEFSMVYDRLQLNPELAPEVIDKSLSPIYATYADYITAQKTSIADPEHLHFWQEQANMLVGFEQASFPVDHIVSQQSSAQQDGLNCEISVGEIDQSLYLSLKEVARNNGVTLNSLLFTGFVLFLRAVKQSDQLVTGVVTSGRSDRIPGGETIVGCCLNTLPVAVSLEHNPNLRELLLNIHNQLAEVVDKCVFPLSEIANMARKISGDSELGQLFDCTYDFESYRHVADGEDNRPRLIGGYEMTNYGMEVNILEELNSLTYRFTFDPSLYKSATIDRWMQYFETLLSHIVTHDMSTHVSDISVMRESDVQSLLKLSGFQAAYPENMSIHHFVEKFALESPDQIAVEDANSSITYRELNERANRIAGVLMENSIQQDAPVAVLLERSVDFIAAVVAIWKCGAAYMPIDPEYPLDRVNTLIENAKAGLTISTTQTLQSFSTLTDKTCFICIDKPGLENCTPENIHLAFNPNNLAYVLFTSGSTGTPKGVMIEHRGMMNNIQSEVNDFFLDASSVIAQTASQCFDVSVWQCFAGLSVGAKICIYDKNLQLDPERFIEQCFVKDKVTNLQLVPSYVNELMNFLEEQAPDLSQLRMLSITGEALKLPLLKRWLTRYPQIPVINAYGPAEASDDITHHAFHEVPQDGVIPIGKPTQNANIYILDTRQRLCPPGIIGEICVSGVCVGRGYIHDPERTAASFGTDPIKADATRFYRTGDLGRWRDDGVLEFYGRKDYQVKVNGFRVELGEIENQLAAHSVLTEVAVVMHKQPGSEQRTLSAFVSAKSAVQEADLRAWLAEKVPGHMVPSRFIILDKLPTNTSGKIDKKCLQSWSLKSVGDSHTTETESAKQKMLRTALQTIFKTGDNFDPAESFFSAGGDSLKAIQLISKIKSLGGKLGVQHVFMRPRFADLAECIELPNINQHVLKQDEVVACKPQIDVAALLPVGDRDLVFGGHQTLFELDNIEIAYPLSSLQEGMLFHHMLEEEGAYLGRYLLELHGDLNLDALEQALNNILDKHEALRTGFIYQRVLRPLQVVLKKRHTSILRYDISSLSGDSVNNWLTDFYQREALTPFDLGTDVLLRINVIKLASRHYQLFVTSHHIVMDGWSVANLIHDLLQFYGENIGVYKAGDHTDEQTYAPFRNYIAWLSSQNKASAQNAFKTYLQDYEPVSLKLPHAIPHAEPCGSAVVNQELGLNQYFVQFGEDLSSALNACAKFLDVTPNAVFRVLWGLTLQRYTYAKDVVFGNVISGRFPDIENVNFMVGSLINTLPVRIQCNEETSVAALIKSTQRDFVEMEKHGHLALADIQKASSLQQPLFDHILVSDNFPIDLTRLNSSAEHLGFAFDRIEGGAQTNYDLTVLITTGSNLTVTFEYRSEVFSEQQLSSVGQHLINFAKQVCENPQQRVSELNLLGEREHNYLMHTLSQGVEAIVPEKGLLEEMQNIFAEHANKTALAYKGEYKTFAEVDAFSTTLAQELKAAGIGKNSVVPLIAERSFELVTAIVAILKAGAAWLPIDPSLPEERINFILNDVDPRVVLVWDRAWIDAHQANIAKPLQPVLLNANATLSASPVFTRDRDSLSYIIYTSGSTGEPKGVMIEDVALLNRLRWMSDNFDISSKDTILQKTVFTFDVSVWELLLPFLTGATMSLLEQGAERVPEKIVLQIEADNVSVLHFVPSMLFAFTQEMANISDLDSKTATLLRCFTSGEALNPHHAEAFFRLFPNVALHNLYGPTEAAIDVSEYTVKPGDTRIPIGKPVNGTQLYIFDVFNQPAPMGIAGELHIGGIQLARGYHNRPVLSCEKFSRGLFDDGRVVYKTGDLSSWLKDGNIAYHGRMDHQVKIRGFRIEPGEIENRLCQHEQVQDAVVLTTDSLSGSKQLLAFFVSVSEITTEALRSYLTEFLPAYMVPADFISVVSIPQTTNGKVDRRALLRIAEQHRADTSEHTPPETELQGILLRVWQEVLNTDAIGIDDNFFSVRGDSILAIQIASRIQNFGYRFNVEDIFNYPTIRQLADALEPLDQAIDQSAFVGKIAATPVQLWFADNVKNDRHHWNQSIVLNARHINIDVARASLAALCEHHDILRSKVDFSNENALALLVSSVETFVPDNIERVEVANIAELNACAKALQSSLNLESGPLFKAVILRHGNIDKLLMVTHHLIIDGVSWRILVEDFVRAYHSLLKSEVVQLPPKTHSFGYWREALSELSDKKKLRAETAYWNVVEAYPVEPLAQTTHFGVASEAKTLQLTLDVEQTDRLLSDAGAAYNTKVNELLLSAVSIAIGQWKQVDTLRLDLENHGRENISANLDVTRTVGWFTSVFPVVLGCTGSTPVSEQIKAVKEHLRTVPGNGIGYGVLRYLTKSLTLSATSQSQLLFNYLGQLGDSKTADFHMSSEFSQLDVGEKSELLYPLEIICSVEQSRFQLKLVYSECCFNEKEVTSLMAAIKANLNVVIDHCCSREDTSYTPSDFSDGDIDMEELDAILDAIE